MRNVKHNRFAQRHYEAIAEVMQKAHPLRADKIPGNALEQWEAIVYALCAAFKADHPNKFKRHLFTAACGLQEE